MEVLATIIILDRKEDIYWPNSKYLCYNRLSSPREEVVLIAASSRFFALNEEFQRKSGGIPLGG